MNAMLLVGALRDPASTAGLDAPGWNALIAMARAERLIGTLAFQLDGVDVPKAVRPILADARLDAEREARGALWEADRMRVALAGLDVRAVLLKGTAYAAAGLRAGEGRFIGDLDILVPRDRIDAVEAALFAAGWEWVKPDPYDDAYYRQWMHELPPMIHRTRDRMIDVHHTILPLTARQTPDAAAMIAGAVRLARTSISNAWIEYSVTPGSTRGPASSLSSQESGTPGQARGDGFDGLFILSTEDRICHAAAHMLADGDLAGGLRNLWDLHCLFDGIDAQALEARAARHGLLPHVRQARRLADALYGEGGRVTLSDRLFIARLLARDGWGGETNKLLRHAFYLRSHWLRMPPLMLARHLWTKWRKGHRPA